MHRRGIVVDDIVDAAALLDCEDSRRRRVGDMQERLPRRAAADQRHTALANLLDHGRIEHAGAGAIETAIA